MISFDLETMPKQVRTPDIHTMENGQHLFFIGAISQVFVTKLFTFTGQGSTLLHEKCSYTFS